MSEEQKKLFYARIKNPCFWIGIISVLGASLGIDIHMLTNWSIVKDLFLEVIYSPEKLLMTMTALYSVYSNFITTGFSDVIEPEIQMTNFENTLKKTVIIEEENDMRAKANEIIICKDRIEKVDLFNDGGNIYINLKDLTLLFDIDLNFEGKIPVIVEKNCISSDNDLRV